MRTEPIGGSSPYKTVWWRVDLGGVHNIYSVNILFKNYVGQGIYYDVQCLITSRQQSLQEGGTSFTRTTLGTVQFYLAIIFRNMRCIFDLDYTFIWKIIILGYMQIQQNFIIRFSSTINQRHFLCMQSVYYVQRYAKCRGTSYRQGNRIARRLSNLEYLKT